MGLPAGAYGSDGAYAVEGRHQFAPGVVLPQANFTLASPGYFATLGIPLVTGRDFTPRDLCAAPFTAIVSESLARETFPGEDPLGKRGQCGLDSTEFMTIVGVVGDVRQDSPASRPEPTLYMSLAQHPHYANEVQVVLRTEVPPGSLVPVLRASVRRQHPDVAMRFTTMTRMIDTSIATPRLRARLAALFTGVALLLARAGIYSVIAFSAAQRRGEMALRLALGARAADVWALVARSGLRMASIGIAAGLLAALAVTRWLSSLVFGVSLLDTPTWAGVVGAVAAITLVAVGVPAWRAARADPAMLLRQE